MRKSTIKVCAAALAVAGSMRINEWAAALPLDFSTTFNGEWQTGSFGTPIWGTSTASPDHLFPIAGDSATLASGFKVDVLENNTVSNFNLAGGTLSFQDAATVSVTGN